MPKWFSEFPESTEFDESSAPFRENSNNHDLSEATFLPNMFNGSDL